MKPIIYPIFIIALTALVGCTTTAQRGAILGAHSAIQKGKYEAALSRLSRAEKYVEPTPKVQAEILFLRAQSLEGLYRIEDAMGLYRFLIEKHRDTFYAYQAEERVKRLKKQAEQ